VAEKPKESTNAAMIEPSLVMVFFAG
jgi:hypothetical protein